MAWGALLLLGLLLAMALGCGVLIGRLQLKPADRPVLPSHYDVDRYATRNGGGERSTDRYCPACGKRNGAEFEYCRVCGADLDDYEADLEEILGRE